MPLRPLPPHVGDAVIAAEDRSFYENRGVSPLAIVRALWGNVRGEAHAGRVDHHPAVRQELLPRRRPDLQRKIREAFIALKIDQQKTKDEILEDYLNTIYFGRGAYGIQAAAKAYYGVDAAALTPEQAATAGGHHPQPHQLGPRGEPGQGGGPVPSTSSTAWSRWATSTPPTARALVMPETILSREDSETYGGPNGYLLATVRSELLRAASSTEQQIDTGGLRIVTTISKRPRPPRSRRCTTRTPSRSRTGPRRCTRR